MLESCDLSVMQNKRVMNDKCIPAQVFAAFHGNTFSFNKKYYHIFCFMEEVYRGTGATKEQGGLGLDILPQQRITKRRTSKLTEIMKRGNYKIFW